MALGMSADTNNNRCLATESLSLHVSSTPKAMLFECVNVCVCAYQCNQNTSYFDGLLFSFSTITSNNLSLAVSALLNPDLQLDHGIRIGSGTDMIPLQ